MKKILNLLAISILASSTTPANTQKIININLSKFNDIGSNYKDLTNWTMDRFIVHILSLYCGSPTGMLDQKINIKVDQILSSNKISQKKINETLDSTETSMLKNEQDQEQQISTQEYDKQVTNTYSVTNKIDLGISDTIKIPFDEIKLNFNFSHSTTQTTSTSETIKAPSQKINVSPHKETPVDYDLYSVNYENNYMLNVKLNINSTFSGNMPTLFENQYEWKEFNFYQVLRKIGLDKPDKNNLMYATNDGLYYAIPLILYNKGYDLNVDIKPEQPIKFN